MTSIGGYAFYGCSNLAEIKLSDSITSIGDHTFLGCGSLKKITIPDGVISIGDQAFYQCTNLAEIIFPDSVTSIGRSVLYGCSPLLNIFYGGAEVEWDELDVGVYDATVYYYSETPIYDGAHWRFVDSVPVVWEE